MNTELMFKTWKCVLGIIKMITFSVEIQHWWRLQEWEATSSPARCLRWKCYHYKARSWQQWNGNCACPTTRSPSGCSKYQ